MIHKDNKIEGEKKVNVSKETCSSGKGFFNIAFGVKSPWYKVTYLHYSITQPLHKTKTRLLIVMCEQQMTKSVCAFGTDEITEKSKEG